MVATAGDDYYDCKKAQIQSSKETILQAQVLLLDTLVSHDREKDQELKHYKHTPKSRQ